MIGLHTEKQGSNPLLTVTALSEYMMQMTHLVNENKVDIIGKTDPL
jgi:hypothetical protein